MRRVQPCLRAFARCIDACPRTGYIARHGEKGVILSLPQRTNALCHFAWRSAILGRNPIPRCQPLLPKPACLALAGEIR